MPNRIGKRRSSLVSKNSEANDNVIVLDGDQNNEFIDVNENYDVEDEDDLNYITKKRKSMYDSNVNPSLLDNLKATTSTRANEHANHYEKKIFQQKQYLSNRIDRICEFAQVLMHCLLFKINYYNKKTHFHKYIKYNIIVYKCKSEIVCEYITNCIESLRLILYRYFNLNNDKEIDLENNKLFSIGLAILKSVKPADQSELTMPNLLIKRYTLQIETVNFINDNEDSENSNTNEFDVDDQISDEDTDQTEVSVTKKEEWEFRNSLLKCLYSQDVQYPANFTWQIQLRTTTKQMYDISQQEDLFKLFAWRECDSEEITSVTTKKKDSTGVNQISIRPIKTIETFNKNANLRMQLFVEQPVITHNKQTGIKSTQQLIRNKNLLRRSKELNRSDESS